MEPATESAKSQPRNSVRSTATLRFPYNNLQDCLDVADAIHTKGGGAAAKDQLAAFLNYRSAKSGTLLAKLAAARMYNLVDVENGQWVMTSLARKILMPVYEHDRAEGLVEAFLSVPLFKAMYEEHLGKELPPGLGLKNLFRTRFKIMGRMTDIALRAFLESADQAGFFATRGTRTHLIKPNISKADTPKPTGDESSRDGGGKDGSGGDGNLPPTPPSAMTADKERLRMKYVDKLFEMLDAAEDKAEKKELLDRIEQFLKV